MDHQSLPPNTTAQEDEVTKGQRTINLLWENTQSIIAKIVVIFTILINAIVTVMLVYFNKDMTGGQSIGLSFLNMICGIVISFYFSRTNHSQIGGVGAKATDSQNYVGR